MNGTELLCVSRLDHQCSEVVASWSGHFRDQAVVRLLSRCVCVDGIEPRRLDTFDFSLQAHANKLVLEAIDRDHRGTFVLRPRHLNQEMPLSLPKYVTRP